MSSGWKPDRTGGGDVEVGAQLGVPLQPILVVGLQPIDLPVLEGEEGRAPVDLAVVLQIVHLVVFAEALLEALAQFAVGLVPDAQHVYAVGLQLPAEEPIVGGEIGGDKDEIFHSTFSLSLFSLVVC